MVLGLSVLRRQLETLICSQSVTKIEVKDIRRESFLKEIVLFLFENI